MIDLNHEGRILYVSMTDVSRGDGPGVNEREFILGLQEKFGPRVHVLVPTPRHSFAELNPRQTTFYPNPWKWDLTGFFRQQFQLNREIRRLLARQLFDLVVVRVGVLPLGFYLARNMPVPYAVKSADDSRGLADNQGLKGLLGRSLAPLNRFLIRGILQRALAVDACTEPLLRLQQEEHGVLAERLLLVGNATNVERFGPRNVRETRSLLGIERFEPILGYAGGRPHERGGMQMLDVACRLLADYPRLGVVIVGAPGAERLRGRARSLGIEAHAVIPGRVPYEEVPAYVNSADVCFAMDRADRFRRVGNSYQKVRQALANGKPVITCAARDSFVVREGFAEVVHPDDFDSIEKAVRRILSRDEETKRRLAAKAIAYAREHLSVQAALNRRVAFWNKRLGEESNRRDDREAGARPGNRKHARHQPLVEPGHLAAGARPAQLRPRENESPTRGGQR